MRIVVCIKQVPGTNAVHLDPETRTLIREARHAIINPYDAYAVELAVQLKEAYGGETIALSMGIPATEKILRDTLSRGIDQAVLLTDRAFAGADTWATACTLSRAIRRIGSVDLVLCGKMAIDGDTAQTGPELAECLDFAPVTDVTAIREISGQYLSVRQNIEGGYRDMNVCLPALLTIAKDACNPRLPSIAGIRQAGGKSFRQWTAGDLSLDRQLIGRAGSPTQVIDTFIPEMKKTTRTLSGDAVELADILRRELQDYSGSQSDISAGPEDREVRPAESCLIRGRMSAMADLPEDQLLPGGLWVFAETVKESVHPVACELISCARRLAAEQHDQSVTAVLCGSGITQGKEILVAAGADNVLLCDDAVLDGLPQDECTELMTRLIKTHRPDILLFGATAFGRAVAPRLAARLQTGLTADCTQLQIQKDTGLLLQTRPAFGGNLLATIVTEKRRPQMATVRPGVMPCAAADRQRKGHVFHVAPPLAGTRMHELTRVMQPASPGIAEAEVIVSAGRGIASQKNLALVEELARLLGGRFGVSRPLVDMGWADSRLQIGQTGQAVAPRLLIACGISGAIQHLAGIGGAKKIIAINTDPDAPLFSLADYRIVGDCISVLRQLIRVLQD